MAIYEEIKEYAPITTDISVCYSLPINVSPADDVFFEICSLVISLLSTTTAMVVKRVSLSGPLLTLL